MTIPSGILNTERKAVRGRWRVTDVASTFMCILMCAYDGFSAAGIIIFEYERGIDKEKYDMYRARVSLFNTSVHQSDHNHWQVDSRLKVRLHGYLHAVTKASSSQASFSS